MATRLPPAAFQRVRPLSWLDARRGRPAMAHHLSHWVVQALTLEVKYLGTFLVPSSHARSDQIPYLTRDDVAAR